LSYKIIFKESVYKDLKKVGKPNSLHILEGIEKELPVSALSNPTLKGKFKGLRKLRMGNYRVIYTIMSNEVLILRIGHRKEVYEH
jgi:mRNA interferase RelE/StbE